VDDREFLITSRPWYVWELEVAEEGVRLKRDPINSEIHHRQRENVTTRWKEKGYWKDSWGDLPGWKWRHESSSPEPADPNDMDFTPSEIDALEEIPPPTPPPKPSSLDGLPPVRFDNSWFLSLQNKNAAPPASVQPTLKPQAGSDGNHEGNRPGTTAEHISEEPPQGLVENNASTAPPEDPARQERISSSESVFKDFQSRSRRLNA
jgi:hypothetical protein